MAKTYRKTATIQAIQFTGDNVEEILSDSDFVNCEIKRGFRLVGEEVIHPLENFLDFDSTIEFEFVWYIKTLEGPLEITPGSWAASGGADDFWAIKPDRFKDTYEEVQ